MVGYVLAILIQLFISRKEGFGSLQSFCCGRSFHTLGLTWSDCDKHTVSKLHYGVSRGLPQTYQLYCAETNL